MRVEIKVPPVGESINEVTISQWHKKDGEYVERDEVVCELESDKASFELNAETAGVLKIAVQEGETIEIGTVLCYIEAVGNGQAKPAEASSAAESSAASPSQTSGAPSGEVVEMVVPAVGESITEVSIASWSKQTGDLVEVDELLCEIDSDKATFELTAEHRGILEIIAQEGEKLAVGAPICKIALVSGDAPAPASKATAVSEASGSAAGGTSYATGHASPAAKKIMDEKGLSSNDIKGTGIDGRITKEDALNAQKTATPAQKTAAPSEEAAPTPQGERNERRQKMTSLRKTIARRLVAVKNDTAMLTTFNEVDMQPIMEIRKKYKDLFKEKHEVGLGFMSFFTKACTTALLEWPAVNAKIDGEEMVYHDFCDISIAVSTPRGLVVPVIRNAEKLDFQGVEKEIIRLALRARDNKLTIPEMTGGTFTITNGGIFGSMLSTPIINAPQSAILGMHNIVERPVAINGKVEIRPMMYVALSYDHRIIDGKESVSFLVRVKQLLEDPTRLLLGV